MRLPNTAAKSTLTASISQATFSKNYRPKINFAARKIISCLSTLSFGIYLLHEHNQLRDILWDELVHLTDYIEAPARFLAQAGIAFFAIAAAGLLLEFIRRIITKYMGKVRNLIVEK